MTTRFVLYKTLEDLERTKLILQELFSWIIVNYSWWRMMQLSSPPRQTLDIDVQSI